MSAHIRKCTAQVSKAKDRMLGINLRRLLSITEKFTQIRTTDTLETQNHLSAQSSFSPFFQDCECEVISSLRHKPLVNK